MKRLRKWLMGKLTVNDLVEYFHSIGLGFDLKFNKKQQSVYWAHNSRLYKHVFKG